jgi:bilirubin oxidase
MRIPTIDGRHQRPPPLRLDLDRRGFVRLLGLGASVAAVSSLTGCAFFSPREAVVTVGKVDFRNPLTIPPLAEPVRRGGQAVFDLVAEAGTTRLVSAGETNTWGINGSILGPTLRVSRGDRVVVNVRNELAEATTLHWHGMHLPPKADGGPHQMIAPGAQRSSSWTVDQPAATLWYHPHPHGATEKHVYRGLGGMFIVDDEQEAALDLPRTYGIDDVPVIVQDKSFDEDGQFLETRRRDTGMLGDTILVNGTPAPVFTVTRERTRLRLLNASTARSYAFGFSDGREFTMIASDGGLLGAPVRLTRVQLTPGERAEIILDAAAGETVTLRSAPQELGLSDRHALESGARDELDILQFRAAARLGASAEIPARLATFGPLAEAPVAATRQFELRSFTINGETMDMGRIDTVVHARTWEIWEVRNSHGTPHNFHIHDVQFRILDIDGSPPTPELAGWKDTVYLPPRTKIRLIMRFGDHTDPTVPYMYHCHMLWHEDVGMMGQFVVVEPGQSVVTPPAQGHHG